MKLVTGSGKHESDVSLDWMFVFGEPHYTILSDSISDLIGRTMLEDSTNKSKIILTNEWSNLRNKISNSRSKGEN